VDGFALYRLPGPTRIIAGLARCRHEELRTLLGSEKDARIGLVMVVVGF
jgi:hypothetical protein